MSQFQRLIAVDFDGVIHGYQSGWKGAEEIPDPPVPGALDFLKSLVDDDRFKVVIVSSRLSEDKGWSAVANWIVRQFIDAYGRVEAERLWASMRMSQTRPSAFVTIDDRGITFDGTWPSLNALAEFRPWNKRPTLDDDDPDWDDRLQARFMKALQEVGAPDARVEGKAREVRLQRGDGLVCIPFRLLDGVTPDKIAAIAKSYVEAYDAGRMSLGVGPSAPADEVERTEGEAEIDELIARTSAARGRAVEITPALADMIEVEIVQRDLRRAFGRHRLEPLKGEDGRVTGWSVAGKPIVDRSAMPAQADDEPEEVTVRRRRIIDMLAAAFDAGRSA